MPLIMMIQICNLTQIFWNCISKCFSIHLIFTSTLTHLYLILLSLFCLMLFNFLLSFL